ncbi:hypothetical protein [Mycobacteroides abscessus]|uniref:Uncharacterized protein n=1 Tax=Mycobacteroides abscessus subsp. massiliense TaxID=1962118 RepID=A0A1U0ZE17_9MYCO|nr:hypothetical protein [Mycobacteroides abscessus]SKM23243.1 Uncharacterised protein [Mycobacteroides abscessus subsp. massiliense]SKT04260.1 Uncharacterised protein [Mycobacteroides abscessus subsp. massiliense]SKT64808.1 Uncharacterised protein [Mycobacteroides abscessus subsp. massiliense]SKX21485.1 Uncharacterised protein [Mycobacteroides abscessus subsp. massiliense]
MHWWELGIMSIDWGVVLGWINWGLVINALAAAGSISAAVVALHIATRDRRERQHEHDEAAKAQARLVIVTLYASAQMNVSSPRIALTCKNHSDRPILDVKPDKAWIPGFDEFNNVVGNDETWTVLKPDKDYSFTFALSDGTGAVGPLIVAKGTLLGSLIGLQPIGAVTFTDAEGIRWRKFSTGAVERIDQDA